MNKWLYISLGTIGTVVSIMEYLVAEEEQLAFTTLMITAVILTLLYLFEEWRFYRQHNALLASSQFLVLPTLLLVLGNIIGPLGLDGELLNFSLNLFDINLEFISTFTSLALILPILMLFNLYAKFYSREYPAFVINRETYGPTKLPLTINIITIVLVFVSGYYLGYMDLMGLVFVVGSIVQVTRKKILPFFQDQQSGTTRSRRSRRSRARRSRARSQSSTRTDSGSSSSRSRRGEVPTRPSSGTREISTRSSSPRRVSTTSSDHREIPTRSRNSQSSRNSSSTRRSRSEAPARRAEISDGIEVIPPSKPAKRVKSSKIKSYLPKGNYNRDDLKCIVCYEDFEKSRGGNVILCPNCRFPSHERELRSWLGQSERCPRCSQDIKGNGVFKSRNRISTKQYIKIIRKI